MQKFLTEEFYNSFVRMKLPYSEITNLLQINLPYEKMAQVLNEIGLPVENIDRFEDDIIFDVDIPFNRGELLSIYEVLKQISIYLNVEFHKSHLLYEVANINFSYDRDILEVLEPDFAPLYYGLILKVDVKESDKQLQKRLHKMGFTPINNIVDATNFVCAYFGQPMHAFDYAKIHAGKVIVRKSIEGEKFLGLDEKQRTLKQGIGVIADSEKILALAGIIGSSNSSTTFQTGTVFLECANFNYADISYASKKLSVETESSYRFKRKIPYSYASRALNAFCNLLKNDIKILKAVEYKNVKYNTRKIEISSDFINKRLGVEVSIGKVKEILLRLECKVEINGNIIVVYPPEHRNDIQIREDLIEEIARFVGYKNIKDSTTLKITKSYTPVVEERLKTIKMYLANNSFFECISTSFMSSKIINSLGLDRDTLVSVNAIKNPDKFLRHKILFTLLDVYRTNLSYGFENITLFEVGKVFRKVNTDYIEEENICLISNSFCARDLKNFVINIFKITGNEYVIENSESDFFTNSFSINFAGEIIGYGGEVKKNILREFDIKFSDVYCVEFKIDDIIQKISEPIYYKEIPQFAPLKIDISFLVDKNIEYILIKDFLTKIRVRYLNGFELIDVFTDSKFGDNRKSYTIRLYFQDPKRNLQKKEVQSEIEKIFNELKNKFNAVIRV